MATKIQLDEETHRLLKIYCAKHDLKMGAFVSGLIRARINHDVQERSREEDRQKD